MKQLDRGNCALYPEQQHLLMYYTVECEYLSVLKSTKNDVQEFKFVIKTYTIGLFHTRVKEFN